MLNPLQSRSFKEIIFSKGNDWSYEQEWRICRPLAEAAHVIERKPFPICLFSIPPSCIKAVLFGKNMKMEERDERISSISSDVRYNHIEMYIAYFEHGAYAVRFQKIGALKERQRNNTVMCINSDGTVAADSLNKHKGKITLATPGTLPRVRITFSLISWLGVLPNTVTLSPSRARRVALPTGEFLMGSNTNEKGCYNDEGPQHRRDRVSFCDRTVCRKVLTSTTISRPSATGFADIFKEKLGEFFIDRRGGPSTGHATRRQKPGDAGWGRGKRPVINVSWREAVVYCKWLSKKLGKAYRLPSEAEWECACRAGTATRYSFGEEIRETDANYAGKVGKTTEGGRYPPNAWGLHDMHGNVWEWVEDVWHGNYNGAPTDGSAWTDGEEENSSRDRVFRGGCYTGSPGRLTLAVRSTRFPPDERADYLGFRVARTLD